MKEISKALLEAQKEMGNALKDSKNPFFKSSYADLNSIREACMPSLNKHGIVVLQPTAFIEGKNFIKTILLHESGESMESLTEIVYSKQNDAQSQGSGITYARRYGLQSFVNVGAEDDDGNSSSRQMPVIKTSASLMPSEIIWLTEEQFNVAMKSDKKGILATLSAFNGQKGKKMSGEQLTKLTNQLNIAK
jgi:hypothetical protein